MPTVYYSQAQKALRVRSTRKGWTPYFQQTRRLVKFAAHHPHLAPDLLLQATALQAALDSRLDEGSRANISGQVDELKHIIKKGTRT